MGQVSSDNTNEGDSSTHLTRIILFGGAIGLAYFLLAYASLYIIDKPAGVVPIWLAGGSALAALLLSRRRTWPITMIFLFGAGAGANLLAGNTMPVSLALSFANCAETILSAYLLVRFADHPMIFQKAGQLFLFFGLVTFSSLCAALLGAAVAAQFSGADFGRVWLHWWVVNNLGIFLMTPLILAWKPAFQYYQPVKHWSMAKILEGLVLLGCVVAVSGYLFFLVYPDRGDSILRAYLLLPFLIWGGLRFDRRYVTGLLAFTSLIAIWGTLNGFGQFVAPLQGPETRLLGVQLYLGVLIITTLALSAWFTDLKQKEDLLVKSELEYRNLFQNASIGIFHSAPGAGFLRANPTLAFMLGYDSPQELVAAVTNIPSQLYADSTNYHDIFEKTLQKEGWAYAVNRYHRKDGSLMIGKLSVRKVLTQDGSLAYLEGFVEDITERKMAEDALKQSENLLNESQMIAKVGGWEFDCLSKKVTWTREVYRIYAVSDNYQPVDLAGNISFYAPEDQKTMDNALTQAINQGRPFDLELGFMNAQGVQMWVRTRGNPVVENGQVVKVTGTVMDVSERKYTQTALANSEEQLRLAMEASTDGLWDWHCAQNYFYFSPGYCRMLAYDLDEIPNDINGLLKLVHPDDQQRVGKVFEDCRNGRVLSFEIEMRMLARIGGWKWILSRGRPVKWDVNGKTLRIIGTHVDITEQKQIEEVLRRTNRKLEKQAAANEAMRALLIEQATHDALTGLYNRRFMDDALQREISRANREGIPVSVLMLDIDHFKYFNDTYGHDAGDQVLVALSSLLRLNIRESDIACRFGGEEFIIILPGANIADARRRAEILCEDFYGLRIGPSGYSSTISVGMAVYPQHEISVDGLLRAVDRALYAAKNAGRNCVRISEV